MTQGRGVMSTCCDQSGAAFDTGWCEPFFRPVHTISTQLKGKFRFSTQEAQHAVRLAVSHQIWPLRFEGWTSKAASNQSRARWQHVCKIERVRGAIRVCEGKQGGQALSRVSQPLCLTCQTPRCIIPRTGHDPSSSFFPRRYSGRTSEYS